MKYIVRYFIFALLAAIAYAQQFYFGSFGGGDAGSFLPAQQRDPRQNRGPVVFPPSPAYDGGSSGVVVGASGYGFVPPGGQGSVYPQPRSY